MRKALSFDVAVIGRGLSASASARHLALENLNVALIGPTEEQCKSSKNTFAGHYDSTRVQRIIAQNELWTRLNLDSVKTWKNLQSQTGISFYKENGCLYVNHYQDEYLKSAHKIAKEFDLEIQNFNNSAELKQISPHISIDSSIFGIFEPKLAGLLNPRKLVEAQLKAFSELGGIELNQIVVDVSQSNGGWQVKTESGQNYFANKVLVAAGAFTNFFNLIPRPLAFQNKSEVVIMGRVSREDYLLMKDMPSLLYEVKAEDFDGIYLTAPTETTDGHYFLKMGLNQSLDLNLNDHLAMNDWFNGNSLTLFSPVLERELRKIFPKVNFLETVLKSCVISRTLTENPYIGEVAEGLFVVHGCNGYSAMSSDAQGRQGAALLARGKFDEGYHESDFTLIYQ
jgi:sarcosine oxidase